MDHAHKPSVGTVALSVLVLVLVLATAFLFLRVQSLQTNVQSVGAETNGTWLCAARVCEKTWNPQQWVSANCGLTALQNGSQVVACTVLGTDGQNYSVALESINMTAVSQLCETYTCVQDVLARSVNYTLNVTG